MVSTNVRNNILFQSTPPARGGDGMLSHVLHLLQISIHAPREGGRLPLCSDFVSVRIFQSTPPARGGDHRPGRRGRRQRIFQSTPPARGATVTRGYITQDEYISIHAPREGGDHVCARVNSGRGYFNPRPPRGGRRGSGPAWRTGGGFQSTPPARGATVLAAIVHAMERISIHAPREGGDCLRPSRGRRRTYFNPRPPRGGRRTAEHRREAYRTISIHAPREGGDRSWWRTACWALYFNPRPPRGGRLTQVADMDFFFLFQSTPPARGATYLLDGTTYSVVISIHAPREGGDRQQRRSAVRGGTISIHAPREGGDT